MLPLDPKGLLMLHQVEMEERMQRMPLFNIDMEISNSLMPRLQQFVRQLFSRSAKTSACSNRCVAACC